MGDVFLLVAGSWHVRGVGGGGVLGGRVYSSLRPLGWAAESNPEGGDRRLLAGSTPAPSSQRFCTEQQDISHQCRQNPRIVTVKGSYKGIRLPLLRRILSKQNNLVTFFVCNMILCSKG